MILLIYVSRIESCIFDGSVLRRPLVLIVNFPICLINYFLTIRQIGKPTISTRGSLVLSIYSPDPKIDSLVVDLRELQISRICQSRYH